MIAATGSGDAAVAGARLAAGGFGSAAVGPAAAAALQATCQECKRMWPQRPERGLGMARYGVVAAAPSYHCGDEYAQE